MGAISGGPPPPAPAWTALLWLDWRLLRNRARSVLRNPRRLVPWLLFLVLLIPNLVYRVLLASATRRGPGGAPLGVGRAPARRLLPRAPRPLLRPAPWATAAPPPGACPAPAAP